MFYGFILAYRFVVSMLDLTSKNLACVCWYLPNRPMKLATADFYLRVKLMTICPGSRAT